MTDQQVNREIKRIVSHLDKELDRVERSIQKAQESKTPFVARDRAVMLGSFCVGKMKSKAYAIRTANALNAYRPNERGV